MKRKRSNIPARFRKLCAAWHGGQSSMFYAVSSSNGLYRGNIRPANCETEKEWDLHLWQTLSKEIFQTILICSIGREIDKLSEFKSFVDAKISKLSLASV
jgi:hypothetical protein